MARKVMQRVMEMIQEGPVEIRDYLVAVLQIERVHLANAEAGVKEKLRAELERASGIEK